MQRSTEGVVHASQELVWNILADFGSLSTWAKAVKHSELISSEGEVLSRRVKAGPAALVETVTKFEPSTTLAYSLSGLERLARDITNEWTLASDGDLTRVMLTTTVQPDSESRPATLRARLALQILGSASKKLVADLCTFADSQSSKAT